MNEKIFDEIANLVRSLIDEKKKLARNHALSEVIHFLLSHREYIMYFQSNPQLMKDSVFILEMKKRNIDIPYKTNFHSSRDTKRYFANLFTHTSIFAFVMFRFKSLDAKAKVCSEKQFILQTKKLIAHGIGGVYLDKQKLKTLDAHCENNFKNLLPLDELHNALFNVVFENGIQGITLSKMAQKIGMSTSSLSEHFSNKNNMIFSLIEDALVQLCHLIIEASLPLKEKNERLYVAFRLQLLYFVKYPNIVALFIRLLSHTDFYKTENGKRFLKKLYALIDSKKTESLFSKMDSRKESNILFVWLSSLASSIFIHCTMHHFSHKKILNESHEIFNFIQGGVKNEELMNEKNN